jgi:hypothetical protein
LNLSKSSSEKQNSCCESGSSFDHEKLESNAHTTSVASENGSAKVDVKEQSSSSSAGTPAGDKQTTQMKVTKKKSKLCLLL